MNTRNFLLAGHDAGEVLFKNFKGLPTIAEYKRKETNIGDWTIKPFNLGGVQGYFTNGSEMGTGIALLKNSTTWMSITPMELESHLLPNSLASGTTVIAGLGLGMITLSLLKNPRVDKLIVLEIDQDLIDSFPELIEGESLANWNQNIESGRLEVIQADCLKPLKPEVLSKVRNCDYMWVDVWETLFTNEGLEITQALQRQVKSKVVDFWGMELEFIKQMSTFSNRFSEKHLYKAVQSFNLPLSPLKFTGKRKALYAEICMRAGVLVAKTSTTK
ncbi:hypothetical protein [Vibrio owensii]|uniref:hypothetical protein n=1 Tax=Vibrio harveyi group TaxID=717610 RepID=UPI003CC637E8